ncbi:MAG: hypothetical protein BWY66_02768 [bacterium ADurb.Bin374]|nr:MAG: hypothetical protein BWY66_02768 [bacterium ADurb.Bin374]
MRRFATDYDPDLARFNLGWQLNRDHTVISGVPVEYGHVLSGNGDPAPGRSDTARNDGNSLAIGSESRRQRHDLEVARCRRRRVGHGEGHPFGDDAGAHPDIFSVRGCIPLCTGRHPVITGCKVQHQEGSVAGGDRLNISGLDDCLVDRCRGARCHRTRDASRIEIRDVKRFSARFITGRVHSAAPGEKNQCTEKKREKAREHRYVFPGHVQIPSSPDKGVRVHSVESRKNSDRSPIPCQVWCTFCRNH